MKYTTKLTLKQTPPATNPTAATAKPVVKTPPPTGTDSTAESPRIVDPGPV